MLNHIMCFHMWPSHLCVPLPRFLDFPFRLHGDGLFLPLSPSSPKRFPGINSESSTQLLIYGTQFFIINLPLLLLLIGICRRRGYMYETVARASTAPVPWVILVVVIGYVAWVVVGDDDQPLFFLPLIFLVVVLALALDLRLRNVPRYRVHGAA